MFFKEFFKDNEKSRKSRFSIEFINNLKKLLLVLIEKIILLYKEKNERGSKSLNQRLSLFIKDLFNIMDRGVVLELVNLFNFFFLLFKVNIYLTHMHNWKLFNLLFLEILSGFFF